jgi:hypothetical protein
MLGFWAHDFDPEATSRVEMKSYAEAYYRDHECMEAARHLYPQLMMQLARGFFTHNHWAYV